MTHQQVHDLRTVDVLRLRAGGQYHGIKVFHPAGRLPAVPDRRMGFQIVETFGIEPLHRSVEHLDARSVKDHAEVGARLDEHEDHVGQQHHLRIALDRMFLDIDRYDRTAGRAQEHGAAIHPNGTFQKSGQIRILH